MTVQPGPEKVNEIATRYGLKLLIYFGSYQTEYYSAKSDIDIAYLAKRPLSTQARIGLLNDLILAHRKSEIDLVDLQTAEPILRYEVARNGRVLFEEEEGMFSRYSLYYIKRMYELQPVIKERMRMLMQETKGLNIDE